MNSRKIKIGAIATILILGAIPLTAAGAATRQSHHGHLLRTVILASPAPPGPSTTPAGAKNCAAKPSACGYPDATNTGPVAGVTLKKVPSEVSSGPGWHYDTRGWIEIDTAGTVFSGFQTDTGVDVTADNVTVKNVVIHSVGSVGNSDFGVSIRHAKNTVISDSTIYGPSGGNRLMVAVKNIYGDEQNTSVLRTNIYGVSTGIQMDNGLIQDNYVHDMGFNEGDHINGTTSNGGADLLTIRHNTVFNQLDQTDAISLFEDFGVQANKVIDNNLVAGGGYSIYGGQNAGGKATYGIKITNNRFSRMYSPNGGGYGPIAAWNPNGAGNVLSGNIWDDTLAAVTV